MSRTDLHAIARYYAGKYRWRVMPLHSIRDSALIPCTCKKGACPSVAKHPRTQHGLHDATTDPSTIDAWWTQWPDANIGVATGPDSGLLVVDIDIKDNADGEATIRHLQHEYGSLSDTLWARTGSGGWHCYLQYPDDAGLPNSCRKLGAGIDTRGDGGYVVAPPSRHASGRAYQWHHRRPPATTPNWLVALLTPPPPGPPPPPMGTTSTKFNNTIDGIVRTACEAAPGARNDVLWWAARKLGQHVAAGNLTANDVYALLTPAAAANGLTGDDGERATLRTIRSGVERGATDGATASAA